MNPADSKAQSSTSEPAAAAWFVAANPKHYDWLRAFRTGAVEWDGARSPLAQSNLRRCRDGDPVIAYQSSPAQVVVGLGHIQGEPRLFSEGGERWTKVLIRMDPPPFQRPIPLSEIREKCPDMEHFRVAQPSFTAVRDDEWARLRPYFDELNRAPTDASAAEADTPEPAGEMIITTLDSDDLAMWSRLKNDPEVTWRFGPKAHKGDHVLVYVPQGLADKLGDTESAGLGFLFRAKEDSHEPTSKSRWRQEVRLAEKRELNEFISLRTLRNDPVAGEWGPIRMNFQRIGQETQPVPPPIRRAIWRLIFQANPTLTLAAPVAPPTPTTASAPTTAPAPAATPPPTPPPVATPPPATPPPTPPVETAAPASEAHAAPPEPDAPVLPATDDTSTYTSGPAGYSSEFCGVGGSHRVTDHLGVDTLAQRLAELVALRETKLPLAIGLFGNWGSGKSHFMNLMDRHMRRLATETPADWEKRANEPGAVSRPDWSGQGPWCRQIVPIYFNAWHYLDTNLWASLVSQIFESLFAHLRPKPDELEQVQRLLETASGATARAVEEVKLARAATAVAKVEVQAAEEDRLNQETAVDGLLHALKSLLPEVTPAELQTHAAELLGLGEEVKTLDDLRRVADEAKTLAGRLHALGRTLWVAPGWKWRLGWLVGGVAITGLTAIGVSYLPFLKDLLHDTGQTIAQWLVSLAGVLASAGPVLKSVGAKVSKLEEWVQRAEKAQQQARETPAVRAAKARALAAATREEEARARLAEAESREAALREEARNLAPERRLSRFIEDRAKSAEYRGQLGLVSLARRDFQELSDLFADQQALERKVEQLRASGESEKIAEADQLTALSRSVDRIVLFVDDLDRCEPDKVVAVLQAVHLLLAYPLFAVVVGVDQRCLRQSLRLEFSGLLSPTPNGTTTNVPSPALEAGERPATPLDYLEKIFHIPFHLPPMDEAGYRKLIRSLTAVEPPLPDAPATSEPKAAAWPETAAAAPAPEELTRTVQSHGFEAEGIDFTATVEPALVAAPAEDAAAPGERAPADAAHDQTPPAPTRPLVIGSVPLHDWERTALEEYHSVIRTPRAAKRLLNTYRLVRAGIPAEEWDTFRPDGSARGEYRVAMTLLALAAGHPAGVRLWFALLRGLDESLAVKVEKPPALSLADWQLFQQVHQQLQQAMAPRLTRTMLRRWLDRVERFAF